MIIRKETPKIAWLDVETTGLDAESQHLLEVACLVTDSDLNILDEVGYQTAIFYSSDELTSLKSSANDYVQNMHTATGLWDRLSTGKPMSQVDQELSSYIKQFESEPNQVWLGGNSITLDRNFINKNLIAVGEHLHYRSVDVTSWAGPAEWWYGFNHEKLTLHEAFSDIKESIEELRAIRNSITLTKQEFNSRSK
jgi:oligoribonuclease